MLWKQPIFQDKSPLERGKWDHMCYSKTFQRARVFTDQMSTDIIRNPLCSLASMLHGPLTRYVNLWVAHAPGMPGTLSPPPRVSDPDMHHGACVTHVPWCMPGSLTRGFLWCQWQGKRSRHSRRMRNPQFYVPGKRHISCYHVCMQGYLCKIKRMKKRH